MPAYHWMLLAISAVFVLSTGKPVCAQAVKTAAPVSIHGDLELGGSGITFGNGSVQPSAGAVYARTVVVSPAETPTQSGDALRSALSAITDATEDTPALLKIEPGLYDLGSQRLQMKEWVDIEGSGQQLTLLKGSVGGLEAGVVVGASNAELRRLGVENSGTGTYCSAIFSKECAPRIFRVTAKASGCSFNWAIHNRLDAGPAISHVVAEAFGPATVNSGVHNTDSYPLLSDVEASAAGGNQNYGIYYHQGDARLTRVTARASGGETSTGLYCNQASMAIEAVDISVSSEGSANTGIFLFMADGRIGDARIEASRGSANLGLYLTSASPDLFDLSVQVEGQPGAGSQNYGLYLAGASGPRLDRVAVTVADGGYNRAIFSQSSSPELKHVRAVASGTESYGLHLSGGSLKALHSVFKGGTQSVFSSSGTTAHFGSSRLHGAIDGVFVCAACYDGNFFSLDKSCH